ncbi:MAG: serine hydrolase domain-containing protein, partial [Planctomycetota bacterium]
MLVSALLLAAGLVVPLPSQAADPVQEDPAPAQAESPFPVSNPVAEEVSPAALERLDALVASFVEEGQIVGGELLVIKNGRTLLHTAHGWRDRDAQQLLEPGGVYCVRSMTKSLIGTATRMLIDDRKLKASDPIADYLPCYDVDGLRGITVEMLLRHRGGFPFSLMLGKDLSNLGDIQAVAALARAEHLEFEPGSRFSYSDHSTDTLAAVIEVASGMPVAEFVEQRLLEPLGMTESATLLELGDPLRAKSVSKYVGSPGAWSRYWKPDDPSLFPCFLGSQGLYATTVDYARFS